MTTAKRLLALAAAALLATGCVDDLPTGATLPGGQRVAFAEGLAGELAEAFAVHPEAELSSQLLVGAEWFDVRFTVQSRVGRFVDKYGVKTPYETFVKRVSPRLPVAIEGGAMLIRQVHFNRVPVAGDYPLEIWLVDDAGVESNHVHTRVTVQ